MEPSGEKECVGKKSENYNEDYGEDLGEAYGGYGEDETKRKLKASSWTYKVSRSRGEKESESSI